MKVKFLDGTEGDTDKMRDVIALHTETLLAAQKLLSDAGIHHFIFTCDEEGYGSAAYSIPKTNKLKADLLLNMDNKLREITKDKVCLTKVEDIEGEDN